jgi:hypothetical protein
MVLCRKFQTTVADEADASKGLDARRWRRAIIPSNQFTLCPSRSAQTAKQRQHGALVPYVRRETFGSLQSGGCIQHDVQRRNLRRLGVLIYQESLAVGGYVIAEDVGR